VQSLEMTTVTLLAAGYGTRLRPLTDERPKALVPIGDRPVIALQIERVRHQLGDVSIVTNAHHRAADIESYLRHFDSSVRVSVEEEILGTAGGLCRTFNASLEEPLLVVNADVISSANYTEILGIVSHDSVVLRVVPRPVGQGPVGIDARGNIVRLRQERFGVEVAGADYLGVTAIGAELRQYLPTKGCLVADFLIPLLKRGAQIQSVTGPCDWIDIGTLLGYSRANMDWLENRSLDTWVASDALVSRDVSIVSSIVGEAARINGSGSVTRVVIWPGAEISAPLHDAVVMSNGRVVRCAA